MSRKLLFLLVLTVVAVSVTGRVISKRSADKVVAPEGEAAVAAEPGLLQERWGGYGYRRHHYYYYPSYGYGGYYYPYYNRWYYRDGKPVPEDKAPPAPTSEPEPADVSFPKTKRAADAEKVIAPEGEAAVPAEPGLLQERWGGYGHHRHHYYHYPSYGNAGYYYPYYNRWYYRDGKPVPEDKAPPAPTSEPEPADVSFPKTKRSADKVIAPEGEAAVPAEPGLLQERWGGYGYRRHHYYHYPSYGNAGYYYPYYNRWYYRDGKPVPEDKAPPAPTSEPEPADVSFPKTKRSAEKVIAPDGEEGVAAQPGELQGRWGGWGYRRYYHYYPSYGYGGYYYPYYNRWYYRDGKPVPEDKAPPAPVAEPGQSGDVAFPKTKRSAEEKVVAPEGEAAVPAEPGLLQERWGGYGYRRHHYYYYPSYGYGGYYYPYYNRWYYRDGKPVPEDKAPPAPTSEPEPADVSFPKTKRAADAEKVIAPEGEAAVPAEPGLLQERWGGYGYRRHHYYHYPSYGNAGYYYPYYNRWYYRDGKPVPEDKAPPAPTSEPEPADVSFPKTKRSADKVVAPEGEAAVPAEPGLLQERWGGYGYRRHHYYHYPSYGNAGYYYPYYNRWYYRDGKPVPEDKAPPAPTSEPEPADVSFPKTKRSADKVIAPEGEVAVPAEPGLLQERWGGYGYRRHHYYHYPSYGNAGYYYPYYNRWHYRDGKPVPEDKAPPAPTSEPEK